jgi:hypothetical protein
VGHVSRVDQIKEFALGFVPGYDLYQAARNPNATGWDYAIGIAGILPGAGKGGGLVLKYGDDALDLVKRADNLPGPMQSLIQANRASGKAAEQVLHDATGGASQTFNTSLGRRVVDDINPLADNIAREAKVGRVSLTPRIEQQVLKDAELLKSGVIDGVEWQFFPGKTGVGPTKPLEQLLNECGITCVIHKQ